MLTLKEVKKVYTNCSRHGRKSHDGYRTVIYNRGKNNTLYNVILTTREDLEDCLDHISDLEWYNGGGTEYLDYRLYKVFHNRYYNVYTIVTTYKDREVH